MKKLYVLILVILLTFSLLAACSTNEEPTNTETTNTETAETDTNSTGELKDGKYMIKEPVSDHGNYGMAVMEVKDGKIAAYNYQEYLTNGEEKNSSNYDYQPTLQVIPEFNKIMLETGDPEQLDFDVVSGATHTKEGFKKIAQELLTKASKGDVYKPVYKDGTYSAKASEASHGWLAQVDVIVKEGTIVGVNYAELAVEDADGSKVVFDDDNKPIMGDDGKQKTEPVKIKAGDVKSVENYSYLPTIDAIPAFQKQIIDNNGTENLNFDVVSGATNTKNNIVNLVNEALKSAK